MKETMSKVELEKLERIPLMVRNINGEGVLFTLDGKMIGHQVIEAGHYFYQGHVPNRVRMFRATFIVDAMPSDVPK